MIDVKAFREKWSFLSEKEMYLACSGGVDSMVLLHLLQQSGFKPTLLHVNYMLRGAESEEDEHFIHAYALQENLRLEILKSDLSGHKSGIQEKARKIRYDWFAGKTQAENAILLLAHHEDDQLETFYMNLARKSGNSGLACMPEIQGKLLRPLLPFSKEEIYAFARKRNFPGGKTARMRTINIRGTGSGMNSCPFWKNKSPN